MYIYIYRVIHSQCKHAAVGSWPKQVTIVRAFVLPGSSLHQVFSQVSCARLKPPLIEGYSRIRVLSAPSDTMGGYSQISNAHTKRTCAGPSPPRPSARQ